MKREGLDLMDEQETLEITRQGTTEKKIDFENHRSPVGPMLWQPIGATPSPRTEQRPLKLIFSLLFHFASLQLERD